MNNSLRFTLRSLACALLLSHASALQAFDVSALVCPATKKAAAVLLALAIFRYNTKKSLTKEEIAIRDSNPNQNIIDTLDNIVVGQKKQEAKWADDRECPYTGILGTIHKYVPKSVLPAAIIAAAFFGKETLDFVRSDFIKLLPTYFLPAVV